MEGEMPVGAGRAEEGEPPPKLDPGREFIPTVAAPRYTTGAGGTQGLGCGCGCAAPDPVPGCAAHPAAGCCARAWP